MTTATQILYAHVGSPAVPLAESHDGRCWICAAEMARGVRVEKWMGAQFTGQNRVRLPTATHVCEACIWAMAGKPPDTLRMTSHLWAEGEPYLTPNKGGKPAMRDFLRAHHSGRWFAAIADSGQKHIVPWCPVNPAGTRRGRVVFETVEVTLPIANGAGWGLIDKTTELLTAGATKEEIGRGDYGPRAWSLCADMIRSYEEHWARDKRGGGWFELALWLAQRDEADVAERMNREKAERAEKKAAEKTRSKAAKPQKEKPRGTTRRSGQGDVPDGDGGGAARGAKRVPARRGEPSEALGPATGQDACGPAKQHDSRGVAHDASQDAPVGSPGQLSLFGSETPGGHRPRSKRGK